MAVIIRDRPYTVSEEPVKDDIVFRIDVELWSLSRNTSLI